MSTKEKILAYAQYLVQKRGFNGFSYADIAAEVGIRKASLHHHFASKTDLGVALIDRSIGILGRELLRINQLPITADLKLQAYIDIYRQTLRADAICLGGMLAADSQTLNPALLPGLKRFFLLNQEWLAQILQAGVMEKVFVLSNSSTEHAGALFSSLQGALLIARCTGEHADFERSVAILIVGIAGKA